MDYKAVFQSNNNNLQVYYYLFGRAEARQVYLYSTIHQQGFNVLYRDIKTAEIKSMISNLNKKERNNNNR